MGGRGVSSESSKGSESTFESCKTTKDVADLLYDKYEMNVIESFMKLSPDQAKETALGIQGVVELFDLDKAELNNTMTRLGASDTMKSYVLGETQSRLSNGYVVSSVFMNSRSDPYKELHPMDGMRGTSAHEFGHVLQALLTNREYSDGMDRFVAMGQNKIANKILTKAKSQIAKTDFGKGKSIKELRSGISPYAGKNNCEAMAEAIDDVVVNGSSANPFSVVICDTIKAQLRR